MSQTGHGRATDDFAVTLMLAAVAGAIAQVLGIVAEAGKIAGW